MHPPQSVLSPDVTSRNSTTFLAGVGRVPSPCSSLAAPTVTFFTGVAVIHRVGDTDGVCIAKWQMGTLYRGTIVCFSRPHLIYMELLGRVVVRSFVGLFIGMLKLCRVRLFR